MTNEVTNSGRRSPSPWRMIGWGIAVALVLLPLVAMQFASDVNWSLGDFIIASLLLGLVGLSLELTVQSSGSTPYRIAMGLVILSCLMLVWVNGAVGMIGNEDNPYNLLFLGLIPLTLAGAALVRFRARGMVAVTLVVGLAQAAIAIVGMATDLRGGMFSMLLAGLWLLSAALFRTAAREPGEGAPASR